jgi:BolA protein
MMPQSRKNYIEQRLNQEINPIYLSVEDESKNHHVPPGAETHFKVIAVSHCFVNLSLIKRHQLLNELFRKELKQGLHALSMYLYTPEEWEQEAKRLLKSPNCLGGYDNK